MTNPGKKPELLQFPYGSDMRSGKMKELSSVGIFLTLLHAERG